MIFSKTPVSLSDISDSVMHVTVSPCCAKRCCVGTHLHDTMTHEFSMRMSPRRWHMLWHLSIPRTESQQSASSVDGCRARMTYRPERIERNAAEYEYWIYVVSIETMILVTASSHDQADSTT